jgi:hypothetical protein
VVHLASNTASYRGNGDYIDGAVGSCVPPLGSGERKALAKLARTCRAWEGVALDALWREIPTVEPLFGLFPPSCIGGATRHESLVSTFSMLGILIVANNNRDTQAVHSATGSQ